MSTPTVAQRLAEKTRLRQEEIRQEQIEKEEKERKEQLLLELQFCEQVVKDCEAAADQGRYLISCYETQPSDNIKRYFEEKGFKITEVANCTCVEPYDACDRCNKYITISWDLKTEGI